MRASRTRFRSRGKNRGTTIGFRLARPGTVVLVVMGPSPNCSVAGRKWVRGRQGTNRVRFSGRVNGRPLRPGRYSIAVVVVRRGSRKRIGKIGVEVVPPGRRVKRSSAPVLAPCAASSGGPPLPAVLIGTAPPKVGVAGVSATRSTPKRNGSKVFRPPQVETPGDSGVDLSWVILVITAALGLGIAVYAVNFLRGPETPAGG